MSDDSRCEKCSHLESEHAPDNDGNRWCAPRAFKSCSHIDEPEGYEFRVKLEQSSRGVTGTKWLPQDVLYSAFQMLQNDSPKGAFLVCWYTSVDGGRLKLKFQGCQEHDCQMKALAAELSSYLVAP